MSTTIAALFDMDPMQLTDQDIDLIIAELRRNRVEYKAEAAAPKPAKAKKEVDLQSVQLLEMLNLKPKK